MGAKIYPPPSGWRVARRPSGRRVKAACRTKRMPSQNFRTLFLPFSDPFSSGVGSLMLKGIAMKFCLGGGGHGFIGTQTHLPPKFSFSSDFGHFILKMVENANFSYVSRKKMMKYHNFWWDVPR